MVIISYQSAALYVQILIFCIRTDPRTSLAKIACLKDLLKFKAVLGQTVNSFYVLIKRCVHRAKNSGLLKWISKQEDPVCISSMTPTPAALGANLPDVDSFRGLQAIIEVESPKGATEWHLFWRNAYAADRNEPRFVRTYGIGAAARHSLRDIQLQRETWWKRLLPWGIIATTSLASLAAIVTNWGTLDDLRLQIMHTPEMSVEGHDAIKIARGSPEGKEIALLGDPYFRARLDGLSMKIVPDSRFSAGQALPNGGNYQIPASRRSADISGELKVRLPLEAVPAGRYLVYLSGKVKTKYNCGDLQLPQGPIELDVRERVGARKVRVTPWKSRPSEGFSKTSEALIDFALLFGRVHDKTSNVRFVLEGEWAKWSMDDPPQGTPPDPESQNSPEHPKGIVFVPRNIPSEEFTSLPLRIHVWTAAPHSIEEWQKIVREPTVEFRDPD